MNKLMGLRSQALLTSLILLVVPAVALYESSQYATELQSLQKELLLDTARRISIAIEQSGGSTLADELMQGNARDPARDLYAYPLVGPMVLDGHDDDWQAYIARFRYYGKDNVQNVFQHYTEDSLHFQLLLGEHDDALYLFARVTDNNVVYREVGSLSVHRNDHLQIATVDASGNYRRYTIAPMQPGPANAFLVTSVDDGSRAIREVKELKAVWLATEQGYNVEAKIPLSLVSRALAITVTDVDDPVTREPIVTVGTASTSVQSAIGSILIPSARLANELEELGGGTVRLSIVDPGGRLVARAGDLTEANGPWKLAHGEPGAIARLFSPLISPFLPTVHHDIEDRPADDAHITGPAISAALDGHGEAGTHVASVGSATVVSAAWPLRAGQHIAGILVAEQSDSDVVSLANRYTIRVTGISILIVLAGIIGVLAFAVTVSLRLRRLARDVDASTDPQGRIRNLLPSAATGDEIGTLSQGFSKTLARLQQYNRYLEDMARQLSHELRTPLTVIRSSLDNLSMGELDDAARIYVSRAAEGVQRLSAILANMTEASRLEETMNPAEMEFFDLEEVVSGCVQGYELAWPRQAFELSVESELDKLSGLPDLIAQMLDKLIANAVEFATAGTPVKVRLTREGEAAVLRVINNGPTLPGDVQDRLFDSMISVRRGGEDQGSHLGLGLYIARIIAEFHGGTISAHNREDAEGVIVTVRLPIMRLTASV